MGLQRQTVIGVAWNFLEQLLRRGLSSGVTLALAYFLSPADYGLVALTAVFLTLASKLMDSGFRDAVIRLEEATDTDLNTAFIANVVLGALAYAILYLAAPWIGYYYEMPQLPSVIRALGLVVPIHALQSIHTAKLTRDLAFHLILRATFPSAVISGAVAIVAAAAGLGVWTLVLQRLVATIVTTALVWRLSGYRPRWTFDPTTFRSMFSYGYRIFLAESISVAFAEMYVLVIGATFAAAAAGHYFVASRIRKLFLNQLVTGIQQATFPALARVQGNEKSLKSGYQRVLILTTAVVTPTMGAIALSAEPVLVFTFGDEWSPAATLLSILCVGGVVFPLNVINMNLLRVLGRSDLILRIEVFKRILAALLLLALLPYGLAAVAVSQIATQIICYLPNSYYSSRLIGYTSLEQVKDFAPSLALAAVALALGLTPPATLAWTAIPVVSGVFGAAILYIVLSVVLKTPAYCIAMEVVRER